MKSVKFFFVAAYFILALSFSPHFALASVLDNAVRGPQSETGQFFRELGLSDSNVKNPGVVVLGFFNVASGFIGIILIVIISNAGFTWMLAGGDEEKTKKATYAIRNGVIGLVILLMSWSAGYFAIGKLIEAVYH